jgi:5-methyltetrahydropteroyltriglutamate--homocysteine methyltransferase
MATASPTELRTLRLDQIGSLIRPAALLEVYGRWQDGQADDATLRAAQDEAIRAVIARQAAMRYPVLTDGEFRRVNFQDSFVAAISNFQRYYNLMNPPPGQRPGAIGRLTARPGLARNLALEEWRFAQALTPTPVKVTVPSPGQLAFRLDYDPAAGYRDADELAADVVAIQRQVMGELAAAGCPYVQIDAPAYSEYLDARRIDEAARYLPLDQLALSPQCGFSTAIRPGATAADPDWQWRKLELVQQVGARVWG